MDRELYEYKQFIRKFPTYRLLEYFFNESVDIFKNYTYGTRYDNVPVYDKRFGRKIQDCQFNVSQWDLVESCFYSIKYSNDYRNSIIDKNVFYQVLNKTRRMSEKLEMASELKGNDLYKHLICISNMEFDFEILNIRNRFNRLYHIMFYINNNTKYDQTKRVCYINFKKKFYEITHIEYDKYIKCYMLIVLLATSRGESNPMLIIDNIQFDTTILGFDKEEMKLIIKLQSKDYSFYRNHNNWNILKYNPIVHSEKIHDKYTITNISALLISFSEYMYWSIRNHYRDIGSRYFTAYFGHCFEYYLDDFLDTYNVKHEKIDEGDNKRPDWKIETGKYIFLIEQKAALFPIDTRSITLENRIDILNKYLNDNIQNAFIQLNNYDMKTDKIIIRICLTFEYIYLVEFIQDLLLPNILKSKENQYLNWIVPINDFEKLFILLSNNENEFNSIIAKKIELEKTCDKNGRSFEKLLSSIENEYINEKIDYFGIITDNMRNILKKQ